MTKRKGKRPKGKQIKYCVKCGRQTKGITICGGCRKKEWRRKNPVKASYQTRKYNATRRKIFWDLTFPEFERFCYEEKLVQGSGRSSTSYTVDRIKEGKLPGYTLSNIQVLPNGINSKKEHARRKGKILVYDWQTKTAIYVEKLESEQTEENQF